MIKELSPDLQKKWQEKGFEAPTSIQAQLFEKMPSTQSLIAISPTGTGKTLAYSLPLIEKVEANHTLQAIVLAPTQELVKQIFEVLKDWGALKNLTTQVIIGSANVKRQIDALKEKPEIIVASPGRLLELSNQSKKLKFHQVETVVYDEADYLLEDEQAQTIKEINGKLMRDVQQVWVSATYGPALKAMNDSFEVSLPIIQASQMALTNIMHHAIMTNNRQKTLQLKRLAQVEGMQAIVYFEQVSEVDLTASKLIHEGVKVAVLHGQLNKMERQHAINAFKNGEVIYLLTTDVAARGLDIDNLPCVIHFNRVNDMRTYTHRSGRTGRMGKQGMVLSLGNEQELRDLSDLLKADNIVLTEKYVYQGYLIDLEEYEEMRAQNKVAEVERVQKKKPTVKKVSKKSVSKQVVVKKKKKKNRVRDTKNKGKRKKAEN